MEFLKVYYVESDGNYFTEDLAVSDWYCKPAILQALAWCISQDSLCNRYPVLFLTCSKYGRRQFYPFISRSFPVSTLIKQDYKKDCPWIIPDFNSHIYDNVKD